MTCRDWLLKKGGRVGCVIRFLRQQFGFIANAPRFYENTGNGNFAADCCAVFAIRLLPESPSAFAPYEG